MWFIIVVTIVLLILIHWLYNEFFGYWKKRGVPHPCTLPIVGNLGKEAFTMNLISDIFNQLYKNYKDYLYVGFYQFQNPSLFIRDLELIKTIAIKEFSSFHDNPVLINSQGDPFFAKTPLTEKGNQWKVSRAQVTSGLSKDKVKNMFNLMWVVGKNLVEVLDKEMKTDKPVDGKDISERYMSDILALCLFGFEGNALNDPNSEYRILTRRISDTSFWRRVEFFILFTKPYLGYLLKFSFIPKDANKIFVRIFNKLIQYREWNKVVRNDYLDQMISLKSKLGEKEFTNEDVLSRALTVLLGGIETSSIGLSSILYEIGNNPDIQQKLQEEIDNALTKCNGEITYDELQNMNYLDMVLAESLRKHPPGMFLNRVCTKSITLPPPRGKGTGPDVTVELGTNIVIPVYAVHYDPIYYPEPDKFIPERFSEEAKKTRPMCTYMPFGEGPRMCLGSRFALTEVKVAVIAVLQNFNIRLDPKTTPIFEVDMPNIFLIKKGGIWLRFEKRTR